MRDGVETSGEFVEIDPPRLVFTWGWTHNHAVLPGSTRVVVMLYPEEGGTRVVLHHHDLPDDGQRERHRKGWELYLGPARPPGPARRSRPGPERLITARTGRQPFQISGNCAPSVDPRERFSASLPDEPGCLRPAHASGMVLFYG